DAYVAEFTKDAPRAKLISARAAMTLAADGPVSAEGGVPASAKVEEIAAYVLGRSMPVPVLGDAGEPIGVLDRDAVIEIVFGGPRNPGSEERGERPAP